MCDTCAQAFKSTKRQRMQARIISAASSVNVGAVAESDLKRELCEDCRCQCSVGSPVIRVDGAGPLPALSWTSLRLGCNAGPREIV